MALAPLLSQTVAPTHARLFSGRPQRDSNHALQSWCTANLRTKILDLRGFDSSRISILRGWNSQAHREFSGNVESTNLSRDNLSREIGRTVTDRTAEGVLGGLHFFCGFRAQSVVSTHMMINLTISRTASVLLAAVLLKSAGQGTLLPAG